MWTGCTMPGTTLSDWGFDMDYFIIGVLCFACGWTACSLCVIAKQSDALRKMMEDEDEL